MRHDIVREVVHLETLIQKKYAAVNLKFFRLEAHLVRVLEITPHPLKLL